MTAMRPKLDLTSYAGLLAAFAHDPSSREALLAEQGLSEADWLALDEHWQAELDGDEDGDAEEAEAQVPERLLAFNQAFSEAQQRLAGAPLSLSRYLDVLKQLRAGRELNQALAEAQISLSSYLVSHTHWTRRAQEDDAVREAIQAGS